MHSTLLTPISAEFAGVNLGDARLNRRLVQIAEAADRAPGASIPERAQASSKLEATYRFLGNDRVSAEAVFGGHVEATVGRAQERAEVLVLHDTTDFRFGGDGHREGLNRINSENSNGFLAHVSFCVARDGRPLGSLGLYAWTREGPCKGRRSNSVSQSDPNRESLRWQDAALLTGELLEGKSKAIHVMDREGDCLDLLAILLEHEQRFIIRVAHDRRLEPGKKTPSRKLYESLRESTFIFEREVELSSRAKATGANRDIYLPRKRRVAKLEVRARKHEVFSSHNAHEHLARSLILNFVEVREIDPPQGEPPVLWRLVTTEPIDTIEQTAAVIDSYRCRWLIGASGKGRMIQSVKVRPRSKGSRPRSVGGTVARKQNGEALRQRLKRRCAKLQVVAQANADVASSHAEPVAETVYNERRQQGHPKGVRSGCSPPAGYQRRHGAKDYAETGETLGARRRNLAEEVSRITVSGKS